MTSPGERSLTLEGFSGINIISDPELIEYRELTACDNFYIGGHDELLRRKGAVKISDTAPFGGNFTSFLFNNRQPMGLSIAGGLYSNRLFAVAEFGATALWHSTDGFSWAPLGTTALRPISSIAYLQGKAFFGAANGLASYDGTVLLTGIANTPNSSASMITHRNRLWMTGTRAANAGYRLHFSDANQPSTFQTTSTIDIGPGDDGDITSLAIINDVLYLFKPNSVWALYNSAPNPQDWIARKVTNFVGCDWDNSVVEYQGQIYFVSSQGIYRTNGVNFVNISEPILDSKVRHGLGSTGTSVDKTTLVVFQDQLFVLPANTVSPYNKLYILDLVRNAWYTWTLNMGQPKSIMSVLGPNLIDLMVGYANDVYSLFTSVYQDAGVNYTSRFRTKSFNMDSPYTMKRIRNFFARYENLSTVGAASNWYALFDRGIESSTLTQFTETDPVGSGFVVRPGVFSKSRFRKLAIEGQLTGNANARVYSMNLAFTQHRKLRTSMYAGSADA